MNGWGQEKEESVITTLLYYDCDFVLLCETWLRKQSKVPQVKGYSFFTKHRTEISKKAKVGSGGVAVLVNDKILQQFKVIEIVDTYESILAIKLQHKVCETTLAVVCGYLPPEHTRHGSDPESFFEALTQIVYMFEECDRVYVGGDFNSRIGEKQDYIIEIDDVPARIALDKVSNPHGECFLNFLKDTSYAVINSRITPIYDNFTSISAKGTATVDYLCTKHENINDTIECKVLSMLQVHEEVSSYHIDFQPCKMSDHSIIIVTSNTKRRREDENVVIEDIEQSEGGDIQYGEEKPVKFKVNGVEPNFMSSPASAEKLVQLIDDLMDLRLKQAEVDAWYARFVCLYHEEMSNFYKKLDSTPKSKKKLFCG